MSAGNPNAKALAANATFFEIRLNSVAPKLPIPCDIYLLVNSKPTLFRRKGDAFTADRLKQLSGHGATRLLVPEDQRPLFVGGLTALIKDPGTDTDTKGRVIKESAFVQLQDLFSNPNVNSVIKGTESLVGDMVTFLSGDPGAAASLLKLSSHDQYTFNHSVNVAVYAILLTKKLNGLDPNSVTMAGLAGLLHDVGKREIPVGLLTKMTPLTPEENAVMRQHPLLGAKLLESTPSVSTKVREVVVQHHESFDGSGYPMGLSGDKINRVARVIAIADVFDALTTQRQGQKPFTPQEALDLMSTLSGRFDPSIFQHLNKSPNKQLSVMLSRNFDPCSCQHVQLLTKA